MKRVQWSRRGRNDPGGLATALGQAYDPEQDHWIHLGGSRGNVLYDLYKYHDRPIETLEPVLVENAYRESNWRWPYLHELGDRFPWHTVYRQEEEGHDKAFQAALAEFIPTDGGWLHHITHDYSLGQMPSLIRRSPKAGSRKVITHVVHTPWPSWAKISDQSKDLTPKQKKERKKILACLDELAQPMGEADFIFFHTARWADNYAEYVVRRFKDGNQPRYRIDSTGGRTTLQLVGQAGHATQLVVCPIGVDIRFWEEAASGVLTEQLKDHLGQDFELPEGQILLSYGRLDYTKGVPGRWQAIPCFINDNSQLRNANAIFLEVAGTTRWGVPHFQEEWETCKNLEKEILKAYPGRLIWIRHSLPQIALAPLSRISRVGLFGSLMDGCNLSCKEWVLSQDDADPGVLCLSRDAGAWEELGTWAVELIPTDSKQMAHAFAVALNMNPEERRYRMSRLKAAVRANPLERWTATLDQVATEHMQRLMSNSK